MPLNWAANSLTVIFCRRFLPKFLIPINQRTGIALELLERVPVRRGRIAGSIFRPVGVAGAITKQRLAIHGELQSEVRIDPDELPEQIPNLIGIDLGLVSVRPEHRDARPGRDSGPGSDIVDDRLLLDLIDSEHGSDA